ncbi:unnamed protein product [Pleuronectes platessa]|uniref:Uncharacterized protein n=1 Tax=Pleuronectes platessa TaxID=8262 RepID=A0A9N7UN75_PLEPL|nr:unnamed protein product [Pleuronectes platessa]
MQTSGKIPCKLRGPTCARHVEQLPVKVTAAVQPSGVNPFAAAQCEAARAAAHRTASSDRGSGIRPVAARSHQQRGWSLVASTRSGEGGEVRIRTSGSTVGQMCSSESSRGCSTRCPGSTRTRDSIFSETAGEFRGTAGSTQSPRMTEALIKYA